MKHKWAILLLLSVLAVKGAVGQSILKGRVLLESSKEAVDGATVTLHPKGSVSVLAYTLTGTDGSFSLTPKEELPDSVTINVRSMSIKTATKTVPSQMTFVEFLVQEQVTQLKEVVVKMPKVRQLGDTITYNVGSFIDATDRSIGDVLKKLPGVQVLSSGEVLYQNKPISKFYVEGLDLLQGKYGLATKNIEAKDVASVEVLENYQPIKALKGMETPDVAAINLKLKQSSLGAFFLNAQVGVGVSPLLLSNELVGMRFTRKQQNMLLYKGDNSGRDIAQEIVDFYGIMSNRPEQFMSVVSASAPTINRQHYLFNDAHLASLNDLRTIGKDYTLTTNVNYLFDQQRKSNYAEREIYIANGENIQIVEEMSSVLRKRELEGTITFEGNKDEYYLNNKLNFIGRWNDEHGEVRSGELVAQQLDMPSLNLSNSFEYTKRVGSYSQRLKSDIFYAQQRQQLSVTPSIFPDLTTDALSISSLMQAVDYNKLSTNTNYRRGWTWDRGYAWIGATFFTNHYNISSSLQDGVASTFLEADSLRNNLRRGEIGFSLAPTFALEITRELKPEFRLTVTYLMVNKEDRVHKGNFKSGYWLFNPSLYLSYPITKRIDMRVDLSYGNQIGGVRDDLLGYIMTSYRNLHRNEGIENSSSRADARLNVSYKNPFTTLFLSGGIYWSNVWKNRLYDTHYNGIMSSVTNIVHPHSSPSYGAMLYASKSIDSINSEVTFTSRYNRSHSIILNQGTVSPFDLSSIGLDGSINSIVKRFMVIRYNGSYVITSSNLGKMKLAPMHYYSQSLKTSFIPAKGLILSAELNHYYNSSRVQSERTTWFGNIGAQYKLKGMDIMLDWTNIFNTKQFITQSYSNAGRYYSQYQLRPFEIMLRIRFKIQ